MDQKWFKSGLRRNSTYFRKENGNVAATTCNYNDATITGQVYKSIPQILSVELNDKRAYRDGNLRCIIDAVGKIERMFRTMAQGRMLGRLSHLPMRALYHLHSTVVAVPGP